MKKIFLGTLLFTSMHIFGQQADPLRLWYDEPSGEIWENALPIGNGNIGAMVYGNVSKEIFQLNEGTVWSGSPNRNDNPDALEALPKVRALIFDKQFKAAENLANEKIVTKKSHGQMFQPVGNLELTFEGHQDFNDYSRELNIGTAARKTTYTVAGITSVREALASLADRVLVTKLYAEHPGTVRFPAGCTTARRKQEVGTEAAEPALWGVTGHHHGDEGKFQLQA